MPRQNFNDGQEQIYQDFNNLSAGVEKTLFDRVVFELLQRAEDAFFDDGFLTEFATSTSVTVRAGVGFQSDATQLDPEPKKRLLYRGSQSTHSITSPDSVNDRYDIVCVKAQIATSLTETRKFKNASTSVVTNENLITRKDWEAEISIVAGTPAASPVVPSTPVGYIKISEVLVSAVSGIGGAGAVTDTRDLFPIGGGLLINSTGYQRLTAGLATPISTLLSEIDGFIKTGRPEWMDYVAQGSAPVAPAAGRKRLYFIGDVLYFRNEGGTITPVGSGGGGGGGANWYPLPGNEPIEDTENNEKVWKFSSGETQKLTLFVKVPESYIAGRQIKMYIGQYSPATSNTQLLSATAYLIRKNNDAMTSVANSHASTNAVLTNTVANQYRDAELDLSSSTGQINSFSVSPGDLIKVELYRGTDTDTDDIRFVPSLTEVKFS